jgi:hypothetical protein
MDQTDLTALVILFFVVLLAIITVLAVINSG